MNKPLKKRIRLFDERDEENGRKTEDTAIRTESQENDDEPCCSKTLDTPNGGKLVIRDEDEQEILDLSKQIDSNLEEKAKELNLSTINVKSILHHLIKNPQVLSLLGINMDSLVPSDDEETVQIRLTRRKAKELMDTGKISYPFSLKEPVVASRTFLDVEYNNEDEDDDYDPTKEDPELEGSEADEDSLLFSPSRPTKKCSNSTCTTPVAEKTMSPASTNSDDSSMSKSMGPPRTPLVLKKISVPDIPCFHTRSKEDLATVPIETLGEKLQSVDPDYPQDIMADCFATLDPDYLDFLSGLTFDDPPPTSADPPEEEENDPEYIFAEEKEVDNDEVRSDRATKISKKEVEHLLIDLFDIYNDNESVEPQEENSISVQIGPPETSSAPEILKLLSPPQTASDEVPEETSVNKKFWFNSVLLTNALGPVLPIITLPQKSQATTSSLCTARPSFLPSERIQLTHQLRKHTQLLMQTCLLTRTRSDLQSEANSSLHMLMELEEQRRTKSGVTSFEIANLPAALETAQREVVEVPLKLYANSFFPRKEVKKKAVKPMETRVMVELAASKGVLYPELLPLSDPLQRERIDEAKAAFPFLPSEDMLMAMGLETFRNVRAPEKWTLIAQHLLPVRRPREIVARRRTVKRSSKVAENPIQIWTEQGRVLDVPRDLGPLPTRKEIRTPFEWPSENQPVWLKKIVEMASSAPKKETGGGNLPNIRRVYFQKSGLLPSGSTPSSSPVRIAPKPVSDVVSINPEGLQQAVLLDAQRIVIGGNFAVASIPPIQSPLKRPTNDPEIFHTPTKERKRTAKAPKSSGKKKSSPLKRAVGFLNDLAAVKQKEAQFSGVHTSNIGFLSPKRQLEAEFRARSNKVTDFSFLSDSTNFHDSVVISEPSVPFKEPEELPKLNPTIGSQTEDHKRKKRTKVQKTKDGISGLLGAKYSQQVLNGLCQAYYHDLQKALFMHESKLEKLMQRIVDSEGKDSVEELFPDLVSLLCSDPHPNSLLSRLLTLFLSEEQARKQGCASTRKNYSAAWDTLAKLERYLTCAKSKNFAKVLLRGMLEEGGNFAADSGPLKGYLQKTIGGEKFLHEQVKTIFPEELFLQSVPDECFETVCEIDESVELDEFENVTSLPLAFQAGPDTGKRNCAVCTDHCKCHQAKFKFSNGAVLMLHEGRYVPGDAVIKRLTTGALKPQDEEVVIIDGGLLEENVEIQGLMNLVEEVEREDVDIVREAICAAFGNSRITFSPDKSVSNSSVFLRGDQGRQLFLSSTHREEHNANLKESCNEITEFPPINMASASKEPENPATGWTADEDRILLQVLQLGISVESAIPETLTKLQHRTAAEIRERYDLLVKLLEETE